MEKEKAKRMEEYYIKLESDLENNIMLLKIDYLLKENVRF